MTIEANTPDLGLETNDTPLGDVEAVTSVEESVTDALSVPSNDFGASALIAAQDESADESDDSEEDGAKAAQLPALTGEELVQVKIALEEEIITQIHTIFDPEIPVDIYELGLIYDVNVADDLGVVIQMTLTSPACPVAGTLPLEVEDKALSVYGVKSARVELVWEPPWTPEMMSEAAQLELGFF